MRPESVGRRNRARTGRRREGFALIAALALLVVLGTTGAAMLRMTALQQAGTSRALLSERGVQAVRSGLEWGRARAGALGACPAASSTLSLSEGALAGFQVVVRCVGTRHTEGPDDRLTVHLEARATFGPVGSRDFVYREATETATF